MSGRLGPFSDWPATIKDSCRHSQESPRPFTLSREKIKYSNGQPSVSKHSRD